MILIFATEPSGIDISDPLTLISPPLTVTVATFGVDVPVGQPGSDNEKLPEPVVLVARPITDGLPLQAFDPDVVLQLALSEPEYVAVVPPGHPALKLHPV